MAKRHGNDHAVYHVCGARYDVPDPHSSYGARLTSATARNHHPIAKVAGGVCTSCQQVMELADLIDLTNHPGDTGARIRVFQAQRGYNTRAAQHTPVERVRLAVSLAGRLAHALDHASAETRGLLGDIQWRRAQTSALLDHLIDATKIASAMLADLADQERLNGHR